MRHSLFYVSTCWSYNADFNMEDDCGLGLFTTAGLSFSAGGGCTHP
jgi:hypothetical protein